MVDTAEVGTECRAGSQSPWAPRNFNRAVSTLGYSKWVPRPASGLPGNLLEKHTNSGSDPNPSESESVGVSSEISLS